MRKEDQFTDWLCGKKVEFPYFKSFPDVPMPNSYQTALSQFPASPTNNGREIVLSRCKSMSKSPNNAKARDLDNLGFSVDHDDRIDHMGEWEESDFSKEDHD